MAHGRKIEPVKPAVRDRERCRECPLFEPMADAHGGDMNAPLLNEQGERIVQNGVPQWWKHKDGALVRWGMCGAELPRRDLHTTPAGSRTGTSMREVRSDWFCESAEKHAAIARLTRGA